VSEEAAQAAAGEEQFRYSGGVSVGPPGVPRARTATPADTISREEEKSYNRLLFGQTYRERNPEDHNACVMLCRSPRRYFKARSGVHCPCCYGKVAIRSIYESDVPPEPSRMWHRIGSFTAGWAAAWYDAIGHIRWRPPRPADDERWFAACGMTAHWVIEET
jgi:hypothetical protein